MKKTVLVAGTFDFFHKGHQKFLNDAKALGQKLMVIVARDENVKKIKGFFPTHSEKIRKENIEKFDSEISVFLGDNTDFLKLPLRINPEIIALGYDQQVPRNFSKTFSEKNTQIIRLNAFQPEKFKSSFFRKK